MVFLQLRGCVAPKWRRYCVTVRSDGLKWPLLHPGRAFTASWGG